MATRTYSAEDLKLETENIEYAPDLKHDATEDANATPAVIVTEEDVSPFLLAAIYIADSTPLYRIAASERPSTGTFCPF
jgi:hypothetical protein